jgi:serine/threonine protein kinase/TolA-binding protein
MTGQTISHYRVLEKIGEGATSVVYKAEDIALGRSVALKLLPAEASITHATIARFQHEARTASSLNHPNICTIYEIGECDGQHFIAMELLEGEELSRVIGGRPLETYRLVELGSQIADALDAAHAEGIIHRDIKPANIFVTRRDHVKMLDFGLAMLTPRRPFVRDDSPTPQMSRVGGTVPYMSPEQVSGEELDSRSDLFSTGVVLYEMATGRRAFWGTGRSEIMDAILNQAPVSMRELNPAVPQELERIVAKALEKNRKLRFQTASDLLADLQRLKRDFDTHSATMVPARARQSEEPVRAAHPSVRWRIEPRSLTIGCLVAAVGAAAAYAMTTFRAPRPTVVDARPLHLASGAVPTGDLGTARPTSVERNTPAPTRTRHPAKSFEPPVAPISEDGAVPPPPPPVVVETTAAPRTTSEDELRIARKKLDLKLYDQALLTLRDLVAKDANEPNAAEAYFLMASVHETTGKIEDAMATYLEIVSRYPNNTRAPEALFLLAQDTLRSKHAEREPEARRMFTELAEKYPKSPWAVRGLMARGDLEERLKLYQRDDQLATSVPAALVTYRQVAQQCHSSSECEPALWKLGQAYSSIRRYELAAQTFADLGERYPDNDYDAWFVAAELYERHANDEGRARAAYARVPSSSPRFKEAQKRLQR